MNSKFSFIIGTYFHSQNIEKCKKDKIVTLFFPQICQFIISVFQKNSEFLKFFLEILLRKILIDSRKGVFIFIKNKQTTVAGFFKQKIIQLQLFVNNSEFSEIEKLTAINSRS